MGHTTQAVDDRNAPRNPGTRSVRPRPPGRVLRLSVAAAGALAIAAALCMSAGGVGAAVDYRLPSMGDPADQYMSPAREDKLGRQVVARLLEQGKIIEDMQLRQYLAAVGARLAAHTAHDAAAFHFYPIDSADVNAFALPGGYIGVNAGLITETDNESELAGVMGHEMAHVTQRHIARQIEASSGAGWATAAAVIAAAIAGGGDPDAVSAAMTAGISHLGQQQINYTRAHEYEADRVGIRTMAAAGYDPDAMASFFEKLQRRSRLYKNELPDILRSHPVTTTRMAEAEARARDYPSHKAYQSAAYPLMKARARVLSSGQLSDLKRYYEQRRAGADKPTPALDYGYALTLLRLGHSAAAQKLLEPLAAHDPDQPAYQLALAKTEIHAGQTAAAKKRLESALDRFPDSRAAKLDYAELLMQTSKPQAMRDFLLGQHELLEASPQAQELLARAAGQSGRMGEAYYRQARSYELRGAYPQAINQLRTALQTAELNAFDKARLRAALRQTVAACHAAYSANECREAVRRRTRY